MVRYASVPIVETACVCVALYRNNTSLPAATYLAELREMHEISHTFDASRIAQILRSSRLFIQKGRAGRNVAYALKVSVVMQIRSVAGLEQILAGIVSKAPEHTLKYVMGKLTEALAPLSATYQKP